VIHVILVLFFLKAEGLFKQALKASDVCLKEYNSLSADEDAEMCHSKFNLSYVVRIISLFMAC